MTEPDGLSPRQLAGIVADHYGARLSHQEALVLFLLASTEGLVTYSRMEEYLWPMDDSPMSSRKAIHVLVHSLRQKVPVFRVTAVPRQGYRCPVDLADVTAEPRP